MDITQWVKVEILLHLSNVISSFPDLRKKIILQLKQHRGLVFVASSSYQQLERQSIKIALTSETQDFPVLTLAQDPYPIQSASVLLVNYFAYFTHKLKLFPFSSVKMTLLYRRLLAKT